MRSAETTVLAASMTWASRARPPISWRTLGRRDLRRVPLPAAMMTTPKELVSVRVYVLMCERTGRRDQRLGLRDRTSSLISDFCSLASTELEDRGTEALELVGAKAADGTQLSERRG